MEPPSLCRPMYPLLFEIPVIRFCSVPLIDTVTVLSVQIISAAFHSATGFSFDGAIFGTILRVVSLRYSVQSLPPELIRSPAFPVQSWHS